MTFARNQQEWRERRAAERERNMAILCQPLQGDGAEVMARVRLHRGSYGPAELKAAPKAERESDTTKAAQEHKDALAQLGCMVCRRLFPYLAPGPVELHHLRAGGWGKGDYRTLIPLCAEHHRGDSGVHGLGTKEFDRRYGFTQADLLMDALSLLEAA